MTGGPQLEDGYTRLANELMLGVAKQNLNGTQLRILLIIWRYTYGFKRLEARLSVRFIAETIGTHKGHAGRELAALIERNVVQVAGTGKQRLLRFNKDFATWKPVPRKSSFSIEETHPERSMDMANVPHKQIIEYLNAKAGKRFSYKAKANQTHINGRFAEGRTLDDFMYVIDVKVAHWAGDPKMDQYLRPSTLFAPRNFENYLNQTADASQGPEREIDREAVARDRQIRRDAALRDWMDAGNDPDRFRFEED